MTWLTPDDSYHLAVVGLIQALRLTRAPRAVRLVAGVAGRMAYYLSGSKRRGAEEGLRRWRGESLARRQKRRFFSSVFGESWREILFAAEIERAVRHPALADCRIRGLDHLQSALSEGRGAILWESAGFGHRLYSKVALKS